jgi:hypothetical protein
MPAVQHWAEDIWYVAEKCTFDSTGNTTTALVVALNAYPIAQRQHIRALAAALTAGVSNT